MKTMKRLWSAPTVEVTSLSTADLLTLSAQDDGEAAILKWGDRMNDIIT